MSKFKHLQRFWPFRRNLIWPYIDSEVVSASSENSIDQLNRLCSTSICKYCRTSLRTLRFRHYKALRCINDVQPRWQRQVQVCDQCGWWVLKETISREYMEDSEIHYGKVVGTLKELDIHDLDAPIEELQRYLMANYEKRLMLHPRRYEEVVASVFRNIGYRVRLTSYSADGGIDIHVLDGIGDSVSGIQVKRSKNKIGASQIREFGGALLLNGLTRGVYVTTSEYTGGAVNTAEGLRRRGRAIELVDSIQFYDKMRIAAGLPYRYADQFQAPFARWLDPDTVIPGPTVWAVDE